MENPVEANSEIQRRLRAVLRTEPPRSKSLLITVFGDSITPHGGTVLLSGLIKLLAPFDINDRLVRTSIFRLRREGWFEVKAMGRTSSYSLTPEGVRRFTHAYKRVYAPRGGPWAGNWTVVCIPKSDANAARRREIERELHWAGFGEMGPGVHAHPAADPSTIEDIVRHREPGDPVFVFAARNMEQLSMAPIPDLVKTCWNLDGLVAGYVAFLKRFTEIGGLLSSPEKCAPKDAFAIRTLLIHAFRRVTLHDPLLPSELLPADWPGHQAYELCRRVYSLSYKRAEVHLREILDTADRHLPDAAPFFYERFGGLPFE
jgi:phenylacetic acid degradation operon negative regulatory protein